MLIANSLVSGNRARVSSGGAITVGEGARLQLRSSVLQNNKADRFGGGLFLEPQSIVDIRNTSFIKNEAMEDFGGAILASSNVELRYVQR